MTTGNGKLVCRVLACLLPIGLLSSSTYCQDKPISLVDGGKAKATIVIGKNATFAERHAADELAKYVFQISGAQLPIKEVEGTAVPGKAGAVIAVGLKANNPILSALVKEEKLDDPATLKGHDGYLIATSVHNGTPVLALVGSNITSAVYPVYYLLEYEFGCGFFHEGDFIPKMRTLQVAPKKVSESSRFAIRMSSDPNTCGGWYSLGQLYSFEDWKKYIDWMAKRRMNQLVSNTDGGSKLIAERARQRLEGKEPTYQVSNDAPPYFARQAEIQKKVLEYARSLGMTAICWTMDPPHLECELSMNHPDTGEPDYTFNFYLSHPLTQKWIKLFIEEWVKEFGTDHYYAAGEPYSERRFPEGDVFDDFLAGAARYPMQAIKSVDPKGIQVVTGWPFLYWGTKEQMRRYMENIGGDDFVVWDSGAADTEAGNYYWGRPFTVGGVFYFGGDFTYFGDYGAYQERVQKLLKDPRAEKCIGSCVWTELTHYNPMFWEFAARVAWNPNVDINKYHKHYAETRYGRKLAPVMTKVVELIYKNCYQSPDWVVRWPVYSLWQRLDPREKRAQLPQPALAQLRALEECQDLMLEIADDKVANANPLFGRDLVDILRQEIVILMSIGAGQMAQAYERKDTQAVRSIGDDLLWILRQQEELVSSRPEYRIEWQADHYAPNPAEHDAVVRVIREKPYTHWEPVNLDYSRKDIFELIRYYYRPRFEWYINELVKCIEERKEYPDVESMRLTTFADMYKKWVEVGYDKADAKPYGGTMIDAVEEISRRLRQSEAYKRIVEHLEAAAQSG